MSTRKIITNVRTLSAPTTGVQRYTSEIINRLRDELSLVSPANRSQGMIGHAWEQFVLPCMVKSNLLWSPGNTGPITLSNQVVTIHDLAPIDHPEWSDKKFALWYQLLIPRLIKKVRKIITVSNFTRERILAIDANVEHKIEVIYNGVNVAAYKKLESNHQQKSEYEPYVLVLGNLSPRKNIHTIINAWLSIEKKLPDNIALKVAGILDDQGIYKVTLLSTLPKNLQILGYVDNQQLVNLYQQATAVIYVSLYEGFGLPVLEAMAAGTPVIASNVTAIPEAAGDAAMLVNPKSTLDLANAILEIIENDNKRAELIQKGLIRAQDFTWDKTAELTIKTLNAATLD